MYLTTHASGHMDTSALEWADILRAVHNYSSSEILKIGLKNMTAFLQISLLKLVNVYIMAKGLSFYVQFSCTDIKPYQLEKLV